MATSRPVIEQAGAYVLSQLAPGQEGIILKVLEAEPTMRHYLADLGLVPGATVIVEQVAPFGGPLLVRVGQARYALGREVADKILVEVPS